MSKGPLAITQGEALLCERRLGRGSAQERGGLNPPVTLKDTSFTADRATVGAFTVAEPVLDQLSAQTPQQAMQTQARVASAALGRAESVWWS